MPKSILFCATFCLALSWAQNAQDLSIYKSPVPVVIDGIPDESEWQTCTIVSGFWQNFPYDTALAQRNTEVRMMYDDQFLYVFAKCFEDTANVCVVQSLRRDWSFPVNDAFVVAIDPFLDGTNGFSFGVNACGAQREGLIANGGSFGVTTNWDIKWFSKVIQGEDFWQVEMAIPFKSLRFSPDQQIWKINFMRNDLSSNEVSSWVRVPRQMNVSTLAYTRNMIFETPPDRNGPNIALIPYVNTNAYRDYNGNIGGRNNLEAGLDARISVTSSLSLDITVNPDFSNVEVDRQVTNLTRFSLFFPEQRTFFLENSDLFAQFGFSRIRPFFSRRIGLYNGNQIPIIAGMRLSGKIGQEWRLGLMNITTESASEFGLEAANYTVAAFQRRVFSRSSIAGILVHSQQFERFRPIRRSYNTVVGLDYNIASANDKWRGKVFYHHAFDSLGRPDAGATAMWLTYSSRNFGFDYNHEYVGRNYNATNGFVLRTGILRFEPGIRYRFYPRKGMLISHGPRLYQDIYFTDTVRSGLWITTDHLLQGGYVFSLKNRAEAEISLRHNYTRLTTPFFLTGETPLPVGSYTYYSLYGYFASDFRRKFSWSGTANIGEFYNGRIQSLSVAASWRLQPWGVLSCTVSQDQVLLPAGYPSTAFTLISPRFEISFTKSVFLTTFLQYNTQQDNVNLNVRFQWRFAPMSDLFFVWSDNYLPANMQIRNRGVVLKLTWWIQP